MKRIIAKSMAFIMSLMLLLSVCAATPYGGVNSVKATTEDITIANHFYYALTELLDVSPDTMEAWVNLKNGSTKGGVIVGNYESRDGGFDGCLFWAVTTTGLVRIYWNRGSLDYTFESAGKINDGTWHHLALVRDTQECTFSLYIDGNLAERMTTIQRGSIGSMPLAFGCDYRSWNTKKAPFDGSIRQITIYDGAISVEKIRDDMTKTAITESDTNANLVGNWYLGETWSGEDIEDSGNSGIKARLRTWEKYVAVPEGFFDTDSYDYMFIGIPDIQAMIHYRDLVDGKPNSCENMVDWIIANKERLKIEFCLQVGDLSDSGGVEDYYAKASEVMGKLDEAGVPWSFVQGNHDYDYNCSSSGGRDSEFFNQYFPYSKYSQYSWFGGAYEEGTMANTYFKYDIGGVKYLVINLEFGPRKSVIRWAKRIADMHPDHRVIVATHSYIAANGFMTGEEYGGSGTAWGWTANTEATTGVQLYEGLISQCPNMFMAFSGHVSGDDVQLNVQKGVYGNDIYSWMINNQFYNTYAYDITYKEPPEATISGIGEDMIMLCAVNESARTVKCCWYTPEHDSLQGIQNYFEINF